MRPFVLVLVSFAGVAGLAGCHAPAPVTTPTSVVLDVPDYERFIDATLTLLRERDLPPERVDRDSGLIITRPTTGGQWYEFWRIDSQGGYNVLESSLHTIQRRATIEFTPLGALGDPNAASAALSDAASSTTAAVASASAVSSPPVLRSGRYRITVQVDKERYSAPERQITSASGALAIYSDRVPTTEGLRRSQTRGEHWVPLGRDGLLEAYLLAQVADATPDVRPVAE